MFLLLVCSLLSSAVADIPQNFRITLQRDSSSQIRVPGIFNRGNNTGTVVRPWIKSYGCGQRLSFGQHSLTVEGQDGTRANIDVTDMVSTVGSFGTLMGVCIGFNSAIARSVESVMYVNPPDGGESLIFRPTDTTNQFASFGQISYVNIQRNAFVYGRTMANLPDSAPAVGVSNEVSQVVFVMNGNMPSNIQNVTFTSIIASIDSLGGRMEETDGVWRIHSINNCYARLVNLLPNIQYILGNYQDPQIPASTSLVFYPEDYLIVRGDDVCELKIAPVQPGFAMSITDHLIRRIGGIHFDYANSRIGVFDPL